MTLTETTRLLEPRWLTQCALSRICGGCAMSLGRPIAFLGVPAEVDLNAFHLPPMHLACAEELKAGSSADDAWVLVTTSGFEFVRPSTGDQDPLPRCQPYSLLTTTATTA
ncbi:MAG: hypothetical protein JWQ32_257 [Marmoricola sp.]|nr:hypothetical protein [Marmoricola sp.]